MITIALDESGNFEKADKLRFIGGIIYKGNDVKEEEKRLETLFKEICDNIKKEFQLKDGDTYPNLLHTTDNNGKGYGYDINTFIVKNTIQYLKKSKNYNLTALIKMNSNKIEFGTEGEVAATLSSNIVDDNVASNLYERMAIRTIFDNVYYNPELKDYKVVNLNIATRTVNVARNSSEYKKYKELGYNEKANNENERESRIYITDVKTYKGAISAKLNENSSYNKKEYILNVESINYSNNTTCVFLYLADIICEYIKRCFKSGVGLELQSVYEVERKIQAELETKIMAFFDDTIDLVWNKIIDAYNNNSLVDVLDMIYDIKNDTSEVARYYYNNWIKLLNIEYIFKDQEIAKYIENIKLYFNKSVNQYEKGLWLFKKLQEIIEKREIKNKERYLYDINYELLSAYNHRGDILKALEACDMCEKYKNSGINLMKYISLVNRKSVIYSNIFDYDSAIKELEKLIPLFDTLNYAVELISDELKIYRLKSDFNIEKGKIYSGMGQYYSFKRNYDKAEEKFKSAIKVFQDNNCKENIDITKQYLAHMAISKGDKMLYDEIASELFLSRNLEEQFDNVKELKDRFLLYVYVKALYIFYNKNVPLSVLRELKNFDKIKVKFNLKQHPGSLIAKYIGYLMKDNDKFSKQGHKFIENNINCVKEADYTLNIINLMCILNLYQMSGKNNNNIIKQIEKCYYENKALIKEESFEQFYNEIEDKLTYMYN